MITEVKVKFKALILSGTSSKRVPVEGTWVVVPGWEEFQFVAHPRILGQETFDQSKINISEATTGLTAVSSYPTLDLAREALVRRLAKTTTEQFRKIIAENQPKETITLTVHADFKDRIDAEADKRKVTPEQYITKILRHEVGRKHRRVK